jgi:LacI family transcriptional regulator
MDIASQYGVRIPEDMALVGFDDMTLAAFSKPGLTTIRQPLRDMGAVACKLLLSLVDPRNYPFASGEETFCRNGEAGNKNLRLLLPTKLIVRESCGATQFVSRQVQVY